MIKCKYACFLFGVLVIPLSAISQKAPKDTQVFLQGNIHIDSLLKTLPQSTVYKEKATVLNELAHEFYYVKTSNGLKYGKLALEVSKEGNLKEEEADAYDAIGMNLMGKGDYDTALNCYNASQNIYQQLESKPMMAREIGNEGLVYAAQADYPKAIQYFLDALKMAEDADPEGHTSVPSGGNEIALLSGYISKVYVRESNYKKAMEYESKALSIHKKLKDSLGLALDYGYLGNVYMESGKNDSALSFDLKSMGIHQRLGNSEEIKNEQGALGLLFAREANYEKSLDYATQALKMDEDLDDKDDKARNLAQAGEDNLRIAEDLNGKTKNMDLMIPMGPGVTPMGQGGASIGQGGVYDKMAVSIDFLNHSIAICKQVGDLNTLQVAYSDLAEAQSTNGNYKDAREYYTQYEIYRDSVYSAKSKMRIDNLEMQRNLTLKDEQIQIDKLQSDRKRNQTIYLIVGLVLLSLVLLLVIRERRRSENLLLNILPAQTAWELKVKGKAKANSYTMVTVMFTDFKNFTKAAEKMTPQELVEEIHFCYSEFDRIISLHNVEKIKTIGDGYMAAGGLPVENQTNPADTIKAALEIQEFMRKERARRVNEGKKFFELRIGINTGPVVAGIVGIKKFAYDIWGDTVNIASRIESVGEVGEVTISGATYEIVKDSFTCTHKGKVEAKNKGMIDVYTVEL